AENLALGDRLRRADGGWTKVLAIERLKQGPLQHGYDFVEGPFVVNHKVARNPNLNHRSLIPRGHQISIHTQKAVGAFNRYIVRP
ncbi:MAG: hypothetical protein KC418_20970, partial [Anaerolineales bacterium]|nr:hypothetical protein [Anaerolineales bacterium]